jgi:predicted MPP superfamily phosphohydrolase
MQLCVDKTNQIDADIVVITGDLVDLTASTAKERLEPLKDLKSRHGVYFVVGNHEYFYDVEGIINYIKSIGIVVLENSNVVIDDIVNLSGVYDLAGERHGRLKPDVKKALQNTDESLPTILLSHQPKIVNHISNNDNIDLIISGHTHGGQIFPFGLLVLLDQPYLHGLYNHNEKTKIYVSSGSGYWGPPLRVLAPSEIVKITLQPE